jgi:hypothetical protein
LQPGGRSGCCRVGKLLNVKENNAVHGVPSEKAKPRGRLQPEAMLAACPVGERPTSAYHDGISFRKQPARDGC